MKYLTTISVFMICLVLSLPVYTASVFAQTTGLTNVKVEGADGYEGFVKSEDDTFTFNARACVDVGEAVNPSQVKLWGTSKDTGFSFASCTYVGDGCSYDCRFSRVMSDYNYICPAYSFDINLYDEEGDFVDDKNAEAICDTQAPSLSLSKDKNLVGSNNKINFTYTITDTACDGCFGKCVGIKNIIFNADDYSKTVNINTEPNTCSYSGQLEETGSSFNEGTVSLTAAAYDNFGQISNEVSLMFTTDFTYPVIVLDSFKITDLNDDEIIYYSEQTAKAVLKVNITDSNIEASSIKEDLSSLNLINTASELCSQISSDKIQCTYSNMQFELNSPSFSKTIVVNASDTAGNKKSQTILLSKTFSQDLTSPFIDGLEITDRDNKNIDGWFNGDAFDAFVYINITDKEIGLDESSVYADLHELNPMVVSYSSKQKDSCSRLNDNVTRCRFDVSIDLNKTGSFSKTLLFNALDMAGNNGTRALSYSFNVDETRPEFILIGTNFRNDAGDNFIGDSDKNAVVAAIIEGESGLDYNDVFIDLSSIGLSSKKAADNCTRSGSSWYCYWYGIDSSSSDGVYVIKNNLDTIDNVGNNANKSFEANVTVDTTKPTVENITIDPAAATVGVIGDYIQTGNAMAITAVLKDASGISKAVGDFSSVISNAAREAGTCSRSGDEWICSWSTGEIDLTEYTKTNIMFNFTDVAGNILEYSEEVEVMGVGNETKNYWRSNVKESSPSAIDKEIITLYDPALWFPVELSSIEGKSSSERWPVSVQLGECYGEDVKYISSAKGNMPEFFNYNSQLPGSFPYNVYLKFTMERAIPPDDLDINCTLKIRTLVDSKTVSLEETEVAGFSIGYYNNPLGTMDGRIEDEIERVQEGWLVQAEWIESLNKILTYGKILCNLVNKIRQIVALWSIIGDKLDACCISVIGSAACCPAMRVQGAGQAVLKEALDLAWAESTNKYCKLLNCQLFFNDKWAKDSKNILKQYYTFMAKAYGSKQGYFGNLDPQHSLILSAVFLCLPGVVYNLQKARVIDCMYINCLKQTEYGMPLYMCTYQRSYAYCKFVYGELFNLIPFAAAISQIGQNILKALSHPFEMIGFAVKIACRYVICMTEGSPGCTFCTIAEYVNMALDTLCDLGIGADSCQPMWESLTVDDSVCESALEEIKKPED